MNRLKNLTIILILIYFAASCSVISKEVRKESEPTVPFEMLMREANNYMGKTVILGGYILEIENLETNTIVTVLQTPLMSMDEPKSKNRSEGRFIVSHKGFLDPEVYSKDRKITVAGTVLGRSLDNVENCPSSCLKLESRDIHLWKERNYNNPQPYYYNWYHPYHFYRYPRHHRW